MDQKPGNKNHTEAPRGIAGWDYGSGTDVHGIPVVLPLRPPPAGGKALNGFQLLWLLVFLAAGLREPVSAQRVCINEIMSQNASGLADEEGDHSDWIELYNPGPGPAALEDWALSDSRDDLLKWRFPAVILDPGAFLLVWASGKDRRPADGEWVNGLMREIYPGIQGTAVSTLTQHASYPDHPASAQLITNGFEAPVDEADQYGQKMHGYLRAPATGIYTFWLSSDDNGQLWLSSDDTPGNLRMIAEVTGWTLSREWDKYPEQKSASVMLVKDRYYYIMALSKEGSGGDNLAAGWQLPGGTFDRPISARYLFWPLGALHTNFSISAEGEEILLTDAAGNIADEIPPVMLTPGCSYGRKPDGGSAQGFFDAPTPGKTNGSMLYSEILSPPLFSHPGGFYGAPFQLSLQASQPGVTLLYSLDGSDPTAENLPGTTYDYKNQYAQNPGSISGPSLYRTFRSFEYSRPLEIKDRSQEANQISRVSTTYHYNPNYFPSLPIHKATVVKARAVREGALPGPVVTHTYFVRNSPGNPYALPVVSVTVQEDRLFDFHKGIYVAGTDFEYWRSVTPSTAADGGVPANYHREGEEWEYPATLEYFDEAGSRVLGQETGFRLHGAWSRAHPFKSLRIYARNDYGKESLDYPFFKEQPYHSYKRIVFRNSGNDAYSTMLRDAALEKMVSHLRFETQDCQPSLLFLNGEYWGIHNIRERFDKHYLARKFGIDETKIDLLEDNTSVVEGDSRHYAETLDYIEQNGLRSNDHYNHILTRIDAGSFTDYMISEIFMVNTDWPGNNIKYWRLKSPGCLPGAGPGRDGRWRWMMFDTDFGFGIYSSSDYTKNMMTFTTEANGPSWPNPPWSTYLFRKMLENSTFRTNFIVRFCDLLNTAFLPEVVKELINRMQAAIEPEMPRHIERWRMQGSLTSWINTINTMRTYADRRPPYARTHLRLFFNLGADYTLTADVGEPGQGYVVVNTIPLVPETRGVPSTPYPWKGLYFKNIPLRLEAVASPGYEFDHWESETGSYSQPILELTPAENQTFRAVFRPSAQQEEVIHYWNFNQPSQLLPPSFTRLEAGINPELSPGGSGELTADDGEGFTAVNGVFGDGPGTHLRINNPLKALLTFDLPTTGYKNPVFRYETRRSGQGAGIQVVSVSLNGSDFMEIRRLIVKDDNPELVVLDLRSLAAAANNPLFKIRIAFEQGEGGTAGNNRFDNVTLSGTPASDVSIRKEETAANDPGPELLLFPNPFADEATLQITLDNPGRVDVTLYNTAGEKVACPCDGWLPAGSSSLRIDGRSLPPAVYLLVCRSDSGTFTRKLVKQP